MKPKPDPNNVDMAAFMIGSAPANQLVVGEIADPTPESPTRECVMLLTNRQEAMDGWAWAIKQLRAVTDAKGVPLVLACRMFVEQERENELRLAE